MLVRRGLVVVEEPASGRGRASMLWLPFAETGPWWEGDINAELFEAVLGYSRAAGRRPAAARRDGGAGGRAAGPGGRHDRAAVRGGGVVGSDVPARAGCVARLGRAGASQRPRRQGNTNCWEIPDPRPARARPRRWLGGGWRRLRGSGRCSRASSSTPADSGRAHGGPGWRPVDRRRICPSRAVKGGGSGQFPARSVR